MFKLPVLLASVLLMVMATVHALGANWHKALPLGVVGFILLLLGAFFFQSDI